MGFQYEPSYGAALVLLYAPRGGPGEPAAGPAVATQCHSRVLSPRALVLARHPLPVAALLAMRAPRVPWQAGFVASPRRRIGPG
jgi:hypothetical protein